jgi:hypothetical protein
MILIAHRGNLTGPEPDKENTIAYAEAALAAGFDVELDVWCCRDKFFLGHDHPVDEVDITFLENEKIWCHAKNAEAIVQLGYYKTTYFAQENDKFVLTSRSGYPWFHANCLTGIGIHMINGYMSGISTDWLGICSDVIWKYKNNSVD